MYMSTHSITGPWIFKVHHVGSRGSVEKEEDFNLYILYIYFRCPNWSTNINQFHISAFDI